MDTVGLWLVRFILSLAVATAGVCLAFVTSFQPLIWLVAGALGVQAACALLSTLPTGDSLLRFNHFKKHFVPHDFKSRGNFKALVIALHGRLKIK